MWREHSLPWAFVFPFSSHSCFSSFKALYSLSLTARHQGPCYPVHKRKAGLRELLGQPRGPQACPLGFSLGNRGTQVLKGAYPRSPMELIPMLPGALSSRFMPSVVQQVIPEPLPCLTLGGAGSTCWPGPYTSVGQTVRAQTST